MRLRSFGLFLTSIAFAVLMSFPAISSERIELQAIERADLILTLDALALRPEPIREVVNRHSDQPENRMRQDPAKEIEMVKLRQSYHMGKSFGVDKNLIGIRWPSSDA